MIRQIFRNNFNKLKSEKHLTQREIAKKSGYPISTIACWCSGRNFPTPEAIDVICEIMNISLAELFRGNNEKEIR